MRIYNLEERNNKNIYEFLYESIKQDIISGVLKADEKLPSKRVFARNQGISIVTVENTYGQLLAEGYIYSKPQSGFFVSYIEKQIVADPPQVNFPTNIPTINQKDDVINLISNHTPIDNFPFSTWTRVMRKLLTEREEKLLTSPSTGGVYELRIAIAKHLLEFRGIVCDPDQIIIGAGTEYLYGLIVQLLGRNKVYGLENPGSKKIKRIYEALGVKTTNLEIDDEGIILSPEYLTIPDIIQISPSHQFPMGKVMSIGRRYGALQWASEKSDRYIIEDDYDSEFRLQGRPIPSLFSIDATDKVIYFNTFTKSLTPTIRISYMVLPKPLLNQFNKSLGFYSCTVSNFEQYTLAEFINEGHFERHINRMRNNYRSLRDELIDALLNSKIGDALSITEEDSGIHFLLKIKTDLSDDEIKKKAIEHGVQLAFVSDYYSYNYTSLENKYEHMAIINYSGLLRADINKVAEALCYALS